jgi:hypothetical protein
MLQTQNNAKSYTIKQFQLLVDSDDSKYLLTDGAGRQNVDQ